MNEIIININEANKAQKYQNENELFQIEAFKRVSEILKEHKFGRDTNDITDCRFHDTIFIDGDRGVGKTAFMINIEHYYNVLDCKSNTNCIYEKDLKKLNKYIFLKPVDPTLLEHTEKFLGVILGRIIEYVNDNKKNINDDMVDNYHKSLANLSKSLEAIKTLDQDIGIEEIASNKSSLKLEQYTHEFFKVVSDMFTVDAIIMLIDDVDMAFDKGFDVLEVVRKYLASPYLIPIVAGDMKLYREIVETKFKEKIQFFNDVKYLKDLNSDLKNSEEYKEKIRLLDNLVEQYLHKIFPSEYHVQLKDIFSILKTKELKVLINKKQIDYKDLKDFEIRVINWGINQKEFTQQVFTNNTRDFVQYLYHKKGIFGKIFDEKYEAITYKEKDEKKPYSIITNRFDELIKEKIIEKADEHKKTLKLTADFYRYSKDIDKKRLSLLLDNDVEAFTKDNRYSIHKALKGNFFLNEKIPYNKIDKEIVRDKLYVAKERYKDLKLRKDDVSYLSLYLMLHDNYYSNVTTKWLLITGKFLEAMICIIDNSIEKEQKIKIINNLKYEIPAFAGINKNKYIDNLTSDSKDGSKIKLNDENFENFVNTFDKKINEIRFTSIFLYEMLKKYTNNINILKASTYSKKYEDIDIKEVNNKILQTPIYDTVKRVLYIFLNAISSFESVKSISIENIGVDGDVNNIETNSRPFTNNINLSVDNSVTKILFSIFKSELIDLPFSDSETIFNKNLFDKEINIQIATWNKIYNMFSKYFAPSGKEFKLNNEDKYLEYLKELLLLFKNSDEQLKEKVIEEFSSKQKRYAKKFSEIEQFKTTNEDLKELIKSYKSEIDAN